MKHLREGIKVNGGPLTAAALDGLAEMAEEQALQAGAGPIFDAVRERAALIVSAGLEGNLAVSALSLFEIYAIAVARSEARKAERDLLAATIAAASRLATSDLIPDGQGMTEAKFAFDFERRAWEALEGV